MSEVKLTQYSHGSGCGCKISPKVLDQILHTNVPQGVFSSLLVGNKDKDDAAVLIWAMAKQSSARLISLCQLLTMPSISGELPQPMPSAIFMQWAANQ